MGRASRSSAVVASAQRTAAAASSTASTRACSAAIAVRMSGCFCAQLLGGEAAERARLAPSVSAARPASPPSARPPVGGRPSQPSMRRRGLLHGRGARSAASAARRAPPAPPASQRRRPAPPRPSRGAPAARAHRRGQRRLRQGQQRRQAGALAPAIADQLAELVGLAQPAASVAHRRRPRRQHALAGAAPSSAARPPPPPAGSAGRCAASSGKRRSRDWQKAWMVPIRMPPGRSSTSANSARGLRTASAGVTCKSSQLRVQRVVVSVTHSPSRAAAAAPSRPRRPW